MNSWLGSVGSAVALALSLASCTVQGPIDVNVGKQGGGEIIGRVTSDANGDGVWVGRTGAGVSTSIIDAALASQGSCRVDICTQTVANGVFALSNVPEGAIELYVSCADCGPNGHHCFTGATVTRQNVTDVGELRVRPFGPGAVILACQ
jgi:hypothetical protein